MEIPLRPVVRAAPAPVGAVRIIFLCGHSLATLALFILVGAAGVFIAATGAQPVQATVQKRIGFELLLIAGIIADSAVCAALAAWWADRRRVRVNRQAVGLASFSLGVIAAAFGLYGLANSGVLDVQCQRVIDAWRGQM